MDGSLLAIIFEDKKLLKENGTALQKRDDDSPAK
jgi:hypothetical protein